MKHTAAIQLVVREFGTQPMSPETREALNYLIEMATSVEDLAYTYMSDIEEGLLDAWVDAYDEDAPEASEDERLFDCEERGYITAHELTGQAVSWPEGYYDEIE